MIVKKVNAKAQLDALKPMVGKPGCAPAPSQFSYPSRTPVSVSSRRVTRRAPCVRQRGAAAVTNLPAARRSPPAQCSDSVSWVLRSVKLLVPNLQPTEADKPSEEADGPATSLEEEEAALHAMMNEQNAEWQRCAPPSVPPPYPFA